MANNQVLKDDIASVIKTNGNNEITGALLQSVLFSIVNQLSIGGIYKGLATPATVPGIQDVNVFYLATQVGVYPNFNGLEVKKGEIAIVSNITGAWLKDVLLNFNTIDKIEKTNTVGKVDTYTIFLSNGVNTTFTVKNADENATLVEWEAQNYQSGKTVTKDNVIWRVKNGQSATSADVPGNSEKWEMLGGKIDLEFDENSNNGIANSTVFPLKQALKYFTSDVVLADLSGIAGDNTIWRKDLTPEYIGDLDNSSIYKYDLTEAKLMYIKIRVPNYTDPTNLTCVTFEKLDGTLFEYKAPTPLNGQEDLDVMLDVTDYKSVTATWNTHQPHVIIIYSAEPIEEDSVKKYIDKINKPFKSFIDGGINPVEYRVVEKAEILENPFINGVQNYLNHILTPKNKMLPFSEAGIQIFIWKDIPTKINENKRIVKLDLDFVRIGGGINDNTNLLGIKEDGTIVNLIGSQSPTPTGNLEKLSIDLKPYVKFSLQVILANAAGGNTDKTKINLYSNGNVEEDSLIKFIEDNGGKGGAKVISETLLTIDKPTTTPIVNIIGELPTDASPTRTPTNIEFEYIMNNRVVFKCKSTLAIQGNATATFAKKGYETAFKNYNDAELKVQFGNWAAFPEFHLKAYPNDQTFARDLTAGKLWHQIRKNRPFPGSYIADFNGGKLIDSNKENLQEQSLFFTDGFPIELRVNGVFHGLYILRIKKDRDNYMMNNANPNHIFLDNEESVNWLNFTPSNWKLRSPKVIGGLTNTVLLGKLNRWWDWFKGINDGTIDFESTVNDYLNVDSWVDDLILQQLTAHWDYQTNNILLTSWDGLKLSICYYDGDQTFGFVLGSMGGFEYPLTVDSNGLYWRSDFWRTKLYPKLKTRIQARYTELRNTTISTNNVYNLFKETTDMIPRDLYEKELKAWRIIRPDEGIHSVKYCVNWYKDRLVKLDLIWKL